MPLYAAIFLGDALQKSQVSALSHRPLEPDQEGFQIAPDSEHHVLKCTVDPRCTVGAHHATLEAEWPEFRHE